MFLKEVKYDINLSLKKNSVTMHTCDANSNVPAFLVKLWKLVEDDECNNLITWCDNGTSFIIRNPTKFAKDLLPQYFKHNNMASFIRQLNMYGFRKVINYEQSGLRSESDEMEFQHTFFCKGQGELLELIKRKIPNAKVVEPTVKSNAKDILTDLTSIREKQENMDTMLLKMKQENELLWRELTSMRQKHKAQEQIIQKVIQFLVSIVQRSNQNIGVKRKIPRMIHDSLGSKGKMNQVSRHLNVIRKNASDRFMTVPQDKVISPQGPVIHEVTELDHEDADEPNLAADIQSPSEISAVSSPNTSVITNEDCPLNLSINSPIDTSDTMEPLSILEPLASSRIPISEDCDSPVPEETVTEEILGLPLEFPMTNVLSIPDEMMPSEISPDFAPGTSFVLSPCVLPSPVNIDSPIQEEVVMTEPLQTPIIDVNGGCDIFPYSNSSTVVGKNITVEDRQDQENNFQVAVSDSSLVKSNPVSKNSLSHHLVDVEEELKWLQDQISTNSWNIDASKLLGLFSTDDVANNEHIGDQFANEPVRAEKNDIIGNELVQFNPSMLPLDDFDADNPPFLDYLIPDMPLNYEEVSEHPDLELLQALTETADQKPDIAESSSKPHEATSRTSPKRPKIQRRKRLKTK